MKKKNILKENMKRFGTKNLNEVELQDKMAFLGDDDIDDILDIIMTYTNDPDDAQTALDNFLETGDFGDSAIEANVTRDPRWKFGK